MKNLILIISVLFLSLSVNAQKYIYFPANDTLKADTNYIPSSNGYNLRDVSTGSLSYTFTTSDVADSLSFAGFEWRNNTDDAWTVYTGNAVSIDKTTDGIHKVYLTTPLLDRFIRVRLSCATGDTVAVTNQTLLLKGD